MTNPTADAVHETRPNAGRESFIVKTATTLYAGALVGLAADGYMDNWNNVASSRFLGILLAGAVGDTTASPPVEGRVDSSGAILRGLTLLGTPTQAKVGDLVYGADGNIATLTLTAALSPAIGIFTRYIDATNQEVRLFTPAECEAKV